MPLMEVMIPAEADEVEECVIVTWLKRENDPVQKDEILIIVQAEKISFEVPAPATGHLVAILAQQGEVVKRGQALARLEVTALPESEAPAPASPAISSAPPATPAGEVRASPIAKRLAREHQLDLTQISGSGEGGRITEKDVQTFIAARQSGVKAEPGPETTRPVREVRASPMAKRLAREHQIELAQVIGSGEDGRITEKDVLAFVAKQGTASPEKPAGEIEGPSAPAQTIPLTGMRATIARRMHDSLHRMAQLTLQTEADVTELVTLREQLKGQVALTYTDLIVRACALALRQHPQLNATLIDETIHLLPQINIGVAVALDNGLVVPVIPNADRLTLAELAQMQRRLAERTRAGQLTQAEMSGGTFTVTNLGGFDIDAFTPIINPPEAAILGVGRIVDKVVIHQGKIAQRAMLTLSLTFDHRLVDGAPAAAFLQTIKKLLELPEALNS